jgi:phage-related protein
MANVLSLALRVTADASGLRLDPVQRALVGLGDQAEKLTSQFAKFSGGSEAAAAAQARFEQQSQDLINTLRDGGPGAATQFAAAFERLTEAANKEAAAFQRAQQITEANLTTLERFDRAQAELTEQLNAGRISLETYNRATESAAKGLTDAERAARGLAVQQKEIDTAAASTTLKFNELSGVFSVLPGPLGNISGRISGIASASEGLSRVFAGGLKAGLTSIAASVTALINPFTLALAGITAFAAGAVSVVRGLVALEDRVERLSRLATQLGVSFEFVQVLEEAGRRADVSIEQLSGSFARLQNTLAGADEESKKAQAALQRLGVSVQDFGALSEQQRIDLIGERLAAIEDPAQRSAAAIALFGRSGVQLLPFFNELGGAADDIQTFGAALSETDRTAFSGLGAAFDQVGVAIQGLGQSVLLPFVGLVEGIATAFSGLINIVTVVAQTIGTVLGPILSTVGSVFGAFGDAVNGTIGFFRSFFSTAEETAAVTEKTAEAVTRTAEEVKALDKAFADSQKGLDAAIAKAGEFGQAGFDAAFEFEQALADLQEQANEGELNAEQYARGVANATAEFEKQIDVARRVAEENKRLAEEAQRRAEAEAKAVQDIIDANLEQIRIDEQFGGDSSRARAAENLLKIQQEIVRVEEQLQAARAAGDSEAINAMTSRLATLDQVEARENDIASGAKKDREDAAKEAERLADELNRIAAERQGEIDRVNKQIADAQAKFADRQFEIELARAEELATVRTGAVEINDIRSGGISAFFETLQEDPAIAEAKKQTKELENLRKEIAKLNADKVDILAGTG